MKLFPPRPTPKVQERLRGGGGDSLIGAPGFYGDLQSVSLYDQVITLRYRK
jgi:hypothetical protein